MSGDTYPCGTPKAGAKGAQRAGGESNGDVQKKLLSGRQVEPIRLKGNENLADMIDNCFAGSGFNARRLAEACELYSHMLTKGATVGVTLSGAMTPIGMQGVLISLMEAGFIDWIISTGANLYHDLHRAFDCPVAQGHWATDDNELADVGVARIYDTYIGEDSTLMATDKVILDAARAIAPGEPISTARFHKELAKELAKHAPHPEKSMLIAAEKLGVPIYTSSPGDSSIGMNLVVPQLLGKPILLDPVRDVIETAALVRQRTKTASSTSAAGVRRISISRRSRPCTRYCLMTKAEGMTTSSSLRRMPRTGAACPARRRAKREAGARSPMRTSTTWLSIAARA